MNQQQPGTYLRMQPHRAKWSPALAALLLLASCDFTPGPRVTPTTALPTPSVTTNPSPTVETRAVEPTTESTSSPESRPTSAATTKRASCPPGALGTQDSIGDLYFPGMGNSGYDALHYALDLSVDVISNTITGTTTISARADHDLQSFNLDLEWLTVKSVEVNGAAASFEHKGRELTITPAAMLKSGEEFTATVAYGGVPGKPSEGGATPAEGWTHYDKGIYVAGEPTGADTWYPVNDHPCDKAAYSFKVSVPKPYVVAANGLLQKTTDEGGGRTYYFEEQYPMASYLVTVDIGQFEREESKGPNGLAIRNYFPDDLDAETKAQFAKTPQMIEYFSTLFGPYPFDVYGGVVVDSNIGFAIETQTMSLFSRNVGLGRIGAGEVLSHELAHQWFGDSVSLAQWKDIWLNEGFATYASWLWLEHSQGKSAFDQQVREMYNEVKDEGLPPPGDPPADDLFNPGVYLRGALTLHALRVKVGDDSFFQILKTYADRYKYGNASTEDFIRVAEEVRGQKLDEVFKAWLYDTQLPDLP